MFLLFEKRAIPVEHVKLGSMIYQMVLLGGYLRLSLTIMDPN